MALSFWAVKVEAAHVEFNLLFGELVLGGLGFDKLFAIYDWTTTNAGTSNCTSALDSNSPAD